MLEKCLQALLYKDRNSYVGSLLQGLIHNINSPLQNISMLVEMLTRGQDSMDRIVSAAQPDISLEAWEAATGKQMKRFQQLSEQIVILTEMLRDFMVLQEIERNELEVDLNLALGKLVKVFRADLFFKHHVAAELQIPNALPLVKIPGSRMVPALIYIFKNAIVAMRGSQMKRLIIEGVKEDGHIRITFRDTGCGLDAKEAEDFFKLFSSNWPENILSLEKNEKHFGFGLYAVRELLAPSGAKVEMKRVEDETHTIVEIPH
jgi:signal transduction histidine kinase